MSLGGPADRAGLRAGDVLQFDPNRDEDWVLVGYRNMPEGFSGTLSVRHGDGSSSVVALVPDRVIYLPTLNDRLALLARLASRAVMALVGFRRLAKDLGGDADALLRAAGIAPRHLDTPDRRISYAAMIRLLEDSASKLNFPDFGLRLSDFQDINITGPAAMIALHSETVGDRLRAIATYFYVHASGGAVQLVPGAPGYSDLTFEILLPGLHAKRQINELTIGIGQHLLEMLVSPGFRSERIQFSHRRPDDTRALNRRFGPNLEFDCPVNAIALQGDALARPVATANAEFRDVAIEYVRVHLGNAEDNRVRRDMLLAHQLLPTGRCSLTSVAEILGVHPRTLQRELRAAGADFRGIVNQARRELVTDYLRDTNASLGQIAAMLGYRDQAAFTNAFERWFDVSPGRWRAQSVERQTRAPSRSPGRALPRFAR